MDSASSLKEINELLTLYYELVAEGSLKEAQQCMVRAAYMIDQLESQGVGRDIVLKIWQKYWMYENFRDLNPFSSRVEV